MQIFSSQFSAIKRLSPSAEFFIHFAFEVFQGTPYVSNLPANPNCICFLIAFRQFGIDAVPSVVDEEESGVRLEALAEEVSAAITEFDL